MREADTVAQQVDRAVEVGLRQLPQFGTGFGIGQQHLGITQDGNIDAQIEIFILVVDKALDLMVTGKVLVQILHVDPGARRVGHGVDQLPARIGQGLRHAGIAVGELLDKLLVGIARLRRVVGAVLHQVGLHQVFRRARDIVAEHKGPETVAANFAVEDTRQDHLAVGCQVRAFEKGMIVCFGASGRIEAETAVVHDLFGRIGCYLQVGAGCVFQAQLVVVFAIGAFVQGMAGHVGQHGPLVDGAAFLLRLHVFGSERIVFEDLLDDEVARITRLVQVLVRCRQRLVVPRHIRIGLHFVHIETGTEETGDTLVVSQHVVRDGGSFAVFEKQVDRAQAAPVPSGVDSHRGRVGREHDVFHLHHVGRGLVVCPGISRVVVEVREIIEIIAVHFQVFFCIEVAAHADFRLGLPVHEAVVARNRQQGDCRKGQSRYILFHHLFVFYIC
ncbi:hypothetical protein HMPREF2532_02934 [Bacteroides ovatus]|nr:hypothetical protein HMPREF2532_02934 [Bacteroides ovatus]